MKLSLVILLSISNVIFATEQPANEADKQPQKRGIFHGGFSGAGLPSSYAPGYGAAGASFGVAAQGFGPEFAVAPGAVAASSAGAGVSTNTDTNTVTTINQAVPVPIPAPVPVPQ